MFKEKSIPIICSIIIAFSIAVSGIYIEKSGGKIENGIKYFKNFDRYVEVKGLAEKTVKSNQASLQLGFTASSNNLKDIYKTLNDEQNTVAKFLQTQGFQNDEIQKDPVSITDNSANSYSNNSKAFRYSGNGSVTVISKNVDNITKALQQTNSLVEQGVVISSNNVNYMYTDLNSIKGEMLNEALTNAKSAALEFANNSKSELGAIKYASQGLFSISAINDSLSSSSSIDKKVRVVTTVQFFLKWRSPIDFKAKTLNLAIDKS